MLWTIPTVSLEYVCCLHHKECSGLRRPGMVSFDVDDQSQQTPNHPKQIFSKNFRGTIINSHSRFTSRMQHPATEVRYPVATAYQAEKYRCHPPEDPLYALAHAVPPSRLKPKTWQHSLTIFHHKLTSIRLLATLAWPSKLTLHKLNPCYQQGDQQCSGHVHQHLMKHWSYQGMDQLMC